MEEAVHRPHTNVEHKDRKVMQAKPLAIFLGLVIICGLSFYGGISYQKHRMGTTSVSPNTAAAASSGGTGFGGGFGRRYGGQRPIDGQVTAINSSSITLQSSTTGTSSTFAITSSTTITDNGQTVSASDIQTGDTVVVIASSTSSTQASKILVNPSFGGSGSGSSQSQAPSPTVTND